jgi:N-acetylneuraminic acid mutarotase
LFPGFTKSFASNVTTMVYAYDFNSSSPSWKAMDNFPLSHGFTHLATAVGNSTNELYLCGGYVGANPGRASSQCFIYKHFEPPGQQWLSFPRLPEPRSAGAMLYLRLTNQLLYTAGAARPYPKDPFNTVDHRHTWTYNLSFGIKGKWKATTQYPINANHVGYTSVLYRKRQRHYVLGGQQRQFESNTSIDSMYEWDTKTTRWIKRAKLVYGRGHFASATIPYRNCGFIIAGGTRDIEQTTGDVDYYDISTDAWTSIGRLPPKRGKTIACVIHNQIATGSDLYMSCQTGPINDTFSWRRKVS